jgi:MFS family permease
MRRPWIIGGVVFGALGAAIAAFAPSVPILLLGWCVMQLALNATLAGLTAVLADKVPHIQRGSVSGILGMCLPLGQVAGTYLAQTISGLTLMFLLPAVAGMIMVVVFGVYLPDRRMEPGVRPRESLAAWIAKFWVNPKAAPDFAWAWCSRFTFILGLAFVLTYQALFLLNKLHYSAEELPHLLFVSTSVSAATVAIASIVGGKLSDLFQRRKIFVGVSAAGYGIGLWVIAASPDFNGFLVGMAIAGLAQGVYLAVDLALVTEVLPAGQVDTAKNMGLFNIANALPQSLAPAIAPAILLAGKGNYSWLFVAAGMSSVIGALLIWPVRGAR